MVLVIEDQLVVGCLSVTGVTGGPPAEGSLTLQATRLSAEVNIRRLASLQMVYLNFESWVSLHVEIPLPDAEESPFGMQRVLEINII